jgi:hypothetical protein
VHVFDSKQAHADRRRVKVAITGLEEEDLSRLTPLSFIPIAEGRLIADYRLSRVPVPGALAVGFVLPRRADPQDPLHLALSSALRHCLAYRRPADAWAVARYSTDDRPAATGAGEMPRFSTDAEAIAAAISGAGRRQGSWTETVIGMMRATLATRGCRHLVLVGLLRRPFAPGIEEREVEA